MIDETQARRPRRRSARPRPAYAAAGLALLLMCGGTAVAWATDALAPASGSAADEQSALPGADPTAGADGAADVTAQAATGEASAPATEEDATAAATAAAAQQVQQARQDAEFTALASNAVNSLREESSLLQRILRDDPSALPAADRLFAAAGPLRSFPVPEVKSRAWASALGAAEAGLRSVSDAWATGDSHAAGSALAALEDSLRDLEGIAGTGG
ncbi:hypothetical protein [Microbacterium sp. zg.Y909]|uniref:hypothetical protein n=1 Tax=Microbacterium sp. zg.Y909 TaxID=2969413 RepID=UPI00214B84D8|nr:hypothetical protein [Microbacterium sp. zg.Y909]MCR2824015.1 hypothetical protein [Microbacterium sp. zg.Y909]